MSPTELRQRREALGFTQTGLAKRCRIPLRTWSHWESGTRPIPNYLTIIIELIEKTNG